MVFLVMRMTSLLGIAGLTGVMWLQDHTKKVIVIKNTTQSLFSKDEPQKVTVQEVGPIRITQKSEQNKGTIKKTTQIYNKAAQSKSQKLGDKHILFGALSLIGSLLSPKLFLLVAIGYFLAYQFYYFATDSLRFQRIWEGFMLGGAGLLAYRFLKVGRII